MRRKVSRFAQLLTIAVVAGATLTYAGTAPAEPTPQHSASGFSTVKTADTIACQTAYTGGFFAAHFQRGDCTKIEFAVTNTPVANADTVKVELVGPDGTVFKTLDAIRRNTSTVGVTAPVDHLWRAMVRSDSSFPAGRIETRVIANGENAGSGQFFLNALGADIAVTPKADGKKYAPGEAVTLHGSISELNDVAGTTNRQGTAAQFFLQARTPTGEVRGPYGPFTSGIDGKFSGVQLPAAATRGLAAGPETNFQLSVGVDVINATSTNLVTGSWANTAAGSASLNLISRPTVLLLENKFVSSVGWVKPGGAYPFRVFVKNFTDEWKDNVAVTLNAPPGVVFSGATPLKRAGTVSASPTSISWNLASIATDTTATLVVDARAKNATEDARIVWKDLSTNATMTYTGGPTQTAKTRGPKVIPPSGGFETARYGDKPFPMIPVDFLDRKHKTRHSGDELAKVVNSKDYPGSTYNLYQEMSFGQLHPFGSVPSVGVASAKFDYEHGFKFTERDLKKPTCRGATLGQQNGLFGTPAYPERIHDGWYQLPGTTEYYGGDYPVFTATTIGIDSACGDTSKMIYDAVQIADPEIDYNQFDSDKDGVVDFTMVVFAGCGGNGSSQLHIQCEDNEVYDNPWPHSSSLENSYEDPVTKLTGYISDDQLTDLEGNLQCWEDATYSEFADCESAGGVGRDDLPTYVRVGPYNINPENAIDQASVIAHEYGHHLGLPDFYSSYSAYNDTNLMATDYSQHMTIFGKQDLGWVVPDFMQPGETRNVSDWEEIKNDTGEIQWRTPSGQPYTLSAANGDQNVHNGESYALKLPRKLIIDPAKVEAGASAPDVYWSGRGNDFGCAPKAGHNLDIVLPELESIPEGTPISLKFKSSWDIEWDFDYGFVLVTTDGTNYASLPSENGYTTPGAINPNGSKCQEGFGNGITGTSGAYEGGEATVALDRAESYYGSGSPFIEDAYDLSAFAGKRNVVLRFSYATDPGLDRPGWFIDDLEVRAGDELVYGTDFSEEDELRIFSGGCGEGGRRVASKCTDGWNAVKSDEPSQLDHGYYLELRDRSGFDFASRGQADRGDLAWDAGVFLEYTDEIRGYGNNGGSQPPRQHYLDSQPTPGADCGGTDFELDPEPQVLPPKRCQDVAFTAAAGDSSFRDHGWIDNFADDSSADGLWHFDYGCLTLTVNSMAGNTGHSEALPSDLTANATISAGEGCEVFEYSGGAVNAAPSANATVNPKTPATGETVSFDSAGSFDDRQPADELSYEWSFGDGATASGPQATHVYAAKGTYTATLTVTDAEGLSGSATVPVTVSGPDLQVTNVTAASGKVKQGQTVTVTATVLNDGPGSTPATKTEFLLDESTVLGIVDTPALANGASTQVSISWNAKTANGTHTVKATADRTTLVAEEVEDNNSATRTVTVQGNKVANGDFEQQTSTGQPASWSTSSTGAGTASSTSTGGSEGSSGAQMKGSGGNAAASGSPTWTSAPFSVQAGQLYDVSVSVKTDVVSSAPSLGLVYLGAAGQVLDTVRVLSAPLQTDGFRPLEQSVTIPPLVTQVRVVLTGFAPTDLATRGTVTFDDVGVYAH